VAAQFEECREKIIELPNIIRDLCRLLYYGKVSPWPLSGPLLWHREKERRRVIPPSKDV